ncbi:sensor domain-containing protein [Rugosimonospora acidiphila]|uniref:histidine kinase n=1 Tax=Rugosimonospora acidiphila TaxID=556531 RepID=A0ABP9S611_9ACTN
MDRGIRERLRVIARSCLRGLAIAVAAHVALALVIVTFLSIVFLPFGIGVLTLPVAAAGLRRVTGLQRRWARDWSGVTILSPYREPPPERPELAGTLGGRLRRCRWLLTDPATWRDLLWGFAGLPVGAALGTLPASLILHGVGGILVAPFLWLLLPGHSIFWALSIPAGVVFLPIGLIAGPHLLRGHALFSASLLGPGRRAMAVRVTELSESRTQVVDSSAAELRRIERDLHDGAQARLVALGMNIGLAEQLFASDPRTALTLLAEARESSGQALSELRDLVRGIHPPVLAERGLDGAVRALALTLSLPVDLDIRLPGRAPAPVESAAYFAVAEALTNVVKHSLATQAWMRLAHEHGTLTAIVRDNGVGGAGVTAGGGLDGIRRRLAAFDGTLTVSSPPSGPTELTMELPCALSSVRISPSSGTD